LIKAFERGDEVNECHDDEDHTINKYIHEYKTVEEIIEPGEEEG
jgi:hypothetical protein